MGKPKGQIRSIKRVSFERLGGEVAVHLDAPATSATGASNCKLTRAKGNHQPPGLGFFRTDTGQRQKKNAPPPRLRQKSIAGLNMCKEGVRPGSVLRRSGDRKTGSNPPGEGSKGEGVNWRQTGSLHLAPRPSETFARVNRHTRRPSLCCVRYEAG